MGLSETELLKMGGGGVPPSWEELEWRLNLLPDDDRRRVLRALPLTLPGDAWSPDVVRHLRRLCRSHGALRDHVHRRLCEPHASARRQAATPPAGGRRSRTEPMNLRDPARPHKDGDTDGGPAATPPSPRSPSSPPIRITRPRWRPVRPRPDWNRSGAVRLGDRLILRADVHSVEDGTPIVFHMLNDAGADPSRSLRRIRGSVTNHCGEAEWTAADVREDPGQPFALTFYGECRTARSRPVALPIEFVFGYYETWDGRRLPGWEYAIVDTGDARPSPAHRGTTARDGAITAPFPRRDPYAVVFER